MAKHNRRLKDSVVSGVRRVFLIVVVVVAGKKSSGSVGFWSRGPDQKVHSAYATCTASALRSKYVWMRQEMMFYFLNKKKR